MRWSSSLLLAAFACTRGAPASGTQAPAVTDSGDGKSAAAIASEAGSDPSAFDAATATATTTATPVQDASIPLYEEHTRPAPSYPSLAAFCKAWAGGREGTCAERPMPVRARLGAEGDAGGHATITKLHTLWLHDRSSERMTLVAETPRGFRRMPIDWIAIAYDDATPPWSPEDVEELAVRGPWLVARMAGLVYPPTQLSGTPGAPDGSYRFRYVRSWVWCRYEGDQAICRSHGQLAPEAAWKEQTAAWLAKKPWSTFPWTIGTALEVDEGGSLVVAQGQSSR